MIDPEVSGHAKALLDAHNDALQALRASGKAMDKTTGALTTAIGGLLEANHAHDEAITAAMAGNRAALDLLHHLT